MDGVDMSDITSDGESLVKRWLAATKELELRKSSLNRAECEMKNSSNALGKWLLPNDAVEIGEKFCVWFGDSLIEATVTKNDPKVRIRNKGRSLS
jgi:hypothetical protein